MESILPHREDRERLLEARGASKSQRPRSEKWYPKGHKPELVGEWLLTTDIEIPNPFAAPPE